MTYRPTGGRGGKVLRLLLAVLLTMSPLLTAAQGGGPAPVEGVGATVQMPCHQDTSRATSDADPSRADTCPHCMGNAPASQCHGCGYAAPPGLSALFDTPTAALRVRPPRRTPATDALPESPRDGLFRPPISLS